MAPVSMRPNPSPSSLRPLFEALDQDFDQWLEHFLSKGEPEKRATSHAIEKTRAYAGRMARAFHLDPAYLWHAYLSWQEHWIAFTQGTTDVLPNASMKLGHLPSIQKLERMSKEHPELERFLEPLEHAAVTGEITQTLYLDIMRHLRAIEREKFEAKMRQTEEIRAARRKQRGR